MKKFILLIILTLTSLYGFAKEKPAVWGVIYKTKKEIQGHQYFVYYKENGKDYAYPLSVKSNIDPVILDKLNGKHAKVYGKTIFEKADLDGTKLIMTFLVQDAKELKLSDLNNDFNAYKERTNENYLAKYSNENPNKSIKISDKAANTAIFIGGAALALEVLKNILSPPKN